MERQLPKNVRQIGNVCDEPKIYVEDYVDTFLGQLQEKAMEKPVAAALTGEITKCEDKVVVYISGAIRAEDVEVEGTNLKISEEIWEKIEKEQKEYFKDQKLIGWCLLETGHPMSMNRGAQELHRKMYDQENTIFIWKDASSSDEMYFAYKYNEKSGRPGTFSSPGRRGTPGVPFWSYQIHYSCQPSFFMRAMKKPSRPSRCGRSWMKGPSWPGTGSHCVAFSTWNSG